MLALPLPIFLIELRWRRFVEEFVVRPFPHHPRRLVPTGSRSSYGPHNQTTGVRLQLDFVSQLCLLEKRPWYAKTLRIADSNNPCPGRHVITL